MHRIDARNRPLRAAAAAAALLLAAGFTAAADEAKPADAEAAAKLAAEVCSGCHGPAGISKSPLFPRLAGQQEAYLAAQLHAFKGKTRSDPEAHNYMWGMATLVSDEMVDAFAHYYASQQPAPGTAGDPKQVEQGGKLFEQGIPERGIVACANCHGSNAEGRGIFPRLAGQQSAYVVRQLQVIQKQLRSSPIMHGIIKDLTPEEMTAVAAYVQSK
ncbi:MAG: c-type cytochrome [Nevskia sp.]|nr:c-type cytochrome [Nevskia sp.]